MSSERELTFTFVGDVMPGGFFTERLRELRDRWIPPQSLEWFESDVVFANLECVASNAGDPLPDKIVTYCLPEALAILKDIRVHVVNLANNHQMDYGIEASVQTRRRLDELEILYGGVGRDLEEARAPVIVNRKGWRVGFLFYSWSDEFVESVPAAGPHQPGVSPLRLEYILEDVSRLRERRVDIIVVSLHWGEGKSHYVRPDSVRQAHAIIDAGADIIVGHHTHCLQGYEVYRGKPILYGLGNFFCSSYRKLKNKRLTYGEEGHYRYRFVRERRTLVMRVTRSPDGAYALSYHPMYQLDDPPVLTLPDEAMDRSIRRTVECLSRRIARPRYSNLGFPLYRRLDEVQRIWEDLRETGVKAEHLHPRTTARVLKKLLTAKSFH